MDQRVLGEGGILHNHRFLPTYNGSNTPWALLRKKVTLWLCSLSPHKAMRDTSINESSLMPIACIVHAKSKDKNRQSLRQKSIRSAVSPGMSHHSPHGSMDARSSIFDKKMQSPDFDIWGDIVQDDVPVALTLGYSSLAI